MNIKKEQAIDLWFRFLESPKVKKISIGYGPGYYQQFKLIFQRYDNQIAELNLIAGYEGTLSKEGLKKLFTPYGEFELTVAEAERLRNSWMNRDKGLESMPLEQLLEELKK